MSDRFSHSLRYTQFLLRGLQLCCTVIVLALYSYFLASLAGSGLSTPTHVRAIEGISGIATLWVLCASLMLRCIVGVPLTSFLSMFLDFAFLCSFIYVAQANRGGAGSCQGQVDTPYGSGDSNDFPKNAKGVPKLGQACRILTACMAVSIIVIFLFIFSILIEVQLGRLRHREKRFGPNGLPPSKIEGGISNFSPMRWFQMHNAKNNNDDYIAPTHGVATASGALQVGTVKDFGDDDHPDALHASPVLQPHTPLLQTAPSQLALPPTRQPLLQAQPQPPRPTFYAHGYQAQPLPPARTNTIEAPYPSQPMRRADTFRDQQDQPFGSLPRVETFQLPGQSFGPLQRAETFQPHRTGSVPLNNFQRMDSVPMRSYSPPRVQRSNTLQSIRQIDLYSRPQFAQDLIVRPMQRTATDNVSYMQSQRPHPYGVPGLSRTNSFPYNFQGGHIRSRSASPPRYLTPPPAGTMPYPDTRFLRPDLHPPRPQVPYPDNHPERVLFPGDRPMMEQRQDRTYPNYQYDDSLYDHPR